MQEKNGLKRALEIGTGPRTGPIRFINKHAALLYLLLLLLLLLLYTSTELYIMISIICTD